MGNKRMFSNQVVSSDIFLDMPHSTQNLYFHLNMNADDDGFVSPKRIMRMLGSPDDDIKLLIMKGFVLPFADGVIVITHRKVNNNEIRSDRYKPTLYQEHLKKMTQIDKVYALDLECIPNDIPMVCLDKSRIDKSRVDKNRIEKNISSKPKNNSLEGFDIFWKMYPHTRKGKKQEAKKYFDKLDAIEVMYEIKFIKRLIIFGLQDPQFMPACERWIRDFTPTADIVKEQNIKKIVSKLMQMEVGDKRKEYASQLKSDFGEDVINKYVKEWNTHTNGIYLQFNK